MTYTLTAHRPDRPPKIEFSGQDKETIHKCLLAFLSHLHRLQLQGADFGFTSYTFTAGENALTFTQEETVTNSKHIIDRIAELIK